MDPSRSSCTCRSPVNTFSMHVLPYKIGATSFGSALYCRVTFSVHHPLALCSFTSQYVYITDITTHKGSTPDTRKEICESWTYIQPTIGLSVWRKGVCSFILYGGKTDHIAGKGSEATARNLGVSRLPLGSGSRRTIARRGLG